MTLTEFLLARITEDEAAANVAHRESMRGHAGPGFIRSRVAWAAQAEGVRGHELIARYDPARVLAECEAKRRIVELHKSWPVLAETQPTFERVDNSDLNSFAMQASKRLAWLTEQEYRSRFGDEPPTAPMLAALAAVYADHPDYREEWKP